MFLTTNRIEQFDPAFKSRIHLTLKYHRLSAKDRRDLWRTFILAGSQDNQVASDDELLDEVSSHDLNGREIRNIVRTAYAIALSKGSKLTAQHLRTTLKVMAAFEGHASSTSPDESSSPYQNSSYARSNKRQRLA
jgi:AAA+ superfamily predicted ATPase